MNDAQYATPLVTPRARSGAGRQDIVRAIGGLAALSLVGVAVVTFMWWHATSNTGIRTAFPPDLVNDVMAYDVNDLAPTSYGSLTETLVHVNNSDEQAELDVTLSVDNQQLLPISAPTLSQLRVVNQDGAEASYLGGTWQNTQIVLPHTSASGEFRFAAPTTGGMFVLEYRERPDETPIYIAVGYVLPNTEASQPEQN